MAEKVDQRRGSEAEERHGRPTTATTFVERVGGLASRSGPLGGLVLICLIMFILTPKFLTLANLSNVAAQVAVVAILALGSTFVIVSGGIDLSVGSVLGATGIIFSWVAVKGGAPWPVAIAAGLAAGAAAGGINALLITWANLPPFIATLAMLSVGRGLALVISGGIPLTNIPTTVTSLGTKELFDTIPYVFLVMVVMWLITAGVLRKTYLGRCMYAIGGNEEAARLSGINIFRSKLMIYVMSGLFAGVAGIVSTARLASGQPQAGLGFELDAIASVVIGGASLAGGVGTATGTLVGAFILAVVRDGLNLLNVSSFWQQVVIGGVIALAVMTDTLRRKRAT